MSNATNSNFNLGTAVGTINYDGSFCFSQSNNSLFTGSGNVTITSNLTLGNLNNNSNAATLLGPATGQYKLTLPSTSNTSNTLPYAQNSITIAQNGQASFTPAEFIGVQSFVSDSNGITGPPSLLTNTMMVTFQTFTQANGLIQLFPTTTGTSSGTAIFSKILCVTGMIYNNSQLLSGVTYIGGKVISSDNKTVSLTATQGATVVLGGSVISPAPAGLMVQITIVGN